MTAKTESTYHPDLLDAKLCGVSFELLTGVLRLLIGIKPPTVAEPIPR